MIPNQYDGRPTDGALEPASEQDPIELLHQLKEHVAELSGLCHRVVMLLGNPLAPTEAPSTANGLPWQPILTPASPESMETAFVGFVQGLIRQFVQMGRVRCAETYSSAMRSFILNFREGIDVCFPEIDAIMMEQYAAYLQSNGNTQNTISFYMRILRAIYHRAVEMHLTPDRMPFRQVYTGVYKTVKRALPLPVIRKIKKLDLSGRPMQDFARDMFLLSFYMRGMSFVDMAFLQTANLQNGVLTYRRRKTGQILHIRWERCMQKIVDKYASRCRDPYLLPIICQTAESERRQYRTCQTRVNRHLHTLAKRIGLSGGLTMYVARHSWASVARSNHVPISVISEGMGHDSERTTQIYLAALDAAVIDRANRKLLELL